MTVRYAAAALAAAACLAALGLTPARARAQPAAVAGAAGAAHWAPAAPGLDTAGLALRVRGEAGVAATGRIRVVLARLDPARFTWALARGGPPNGAWHVADAPAAAALALNAGQFTDAGPWGWVVHRGREFQAPGAGPLSAALVVDARGRVDVVDAAALDTARAAAARGAVVEAVQSYPALLRGDGALPDALATPGRGVDLGHRDARLAVGVTGAGRVVVALTRYDARAVLPRVLPRVLPGAAGDALGRAMGEVLGRVPFGLTVPESAALMRALGCRRAVLLDGGLSAQLLVRSAAGGAARAWPGLRAVPLGLVATPRAVRAQ